MLEPMRLFLSYRRGDSAHLVDRMYVSLVEAFGRDSVFKDIDSVPLGADFRQVIEEAVAGCDAVLVIIGSKWLTASEAGQRRIDDPKDFVRMEIETAFARDIPVIPVVEDPAQLPKPEQLPSSLQQLAFRQSGVVRRDPDFERDMGRLIRQLHEGSRQPFRSLEERGPAPKLRYYAYVSRSKVKQLYDQLVPSGGAPWSETVEAAAGARHSPHMNSGVHENPPSVVSALDAVIKHIEAHEKVMDLEAICQAKAGVALDAFCYSYRGRFFNLGSIGRDREGGIYINGAALERSADSILLSKSLLIEPARAENAIVEIGPNKARVVSDMCIICSSIGEFTLRLACSYKFFSDMGGSWDEHAGEWRVNPHSGNEHFFSGAADAWFETLVFVNGIKGDTILGSPLFLAIVNDPSMRL
jgi:hypothetical protein